MLSLEMEKGTVISFGEGEDRVRLMVAVADPSMVVDRAEANSMDRLLTSAVAEWPRTRSEFSAKKLSLARKLMRPMLDSVKDLTW